MYNNTNYRILCCNDQCLQYLQHFYTTAISSMLTIMDITDCFEQYDTKFIQYRSYNCYTYTCKNQ